MFGSSDKNQPDDNQSNGDAGDSALPVIPMPEDSLSSAPPEPLITPSAPPLNDAMGQMPADTVMPVPAHTEVPEMTPKKDKKGDKPQAVPSAEPDAEDEELFDIKQQALHNLAPLVDKLDQTPEEKFKTTMMLIQASDNASLIKEAYEAANSISDEKARAQALLDVVNEINYFTQHPSTEQN
ncbi:MAG TPA: hypothetical protein VFW52_01795 [Candidatus Saccharimonadales bacterium]|nr:hypothetical protein [Candidatus Saccharimonadales bacterium]